MKNVLLIIVVLFLFSCKENRSADKEMETVQATVEKKELDEELSSYLKEFIEDEIRKDSSYCKVIYTIEFVNDEDMGFTDKDSVILISTLNCFIRTTGYQGIFIFEGYPVVVIDEKNVGYQLYGKQELMDIPLYALKCIDKKVNEMSMLKVIKGELVEWHP